MIDLDALVTARLNDVSLTRLVGTRCMPVEPEQESTQMPYVVFEVARGQAWPGIDKVYHGSLDNQIVVSCRDIHLDTLLPVVDAVYELLHGWRDFENGIQICRLVSHEKEPAGEYYHITLTFRVVI